MRALSLVALVVLVTWDVVSAAPAVRVSRVPLTRNELYELEARSRMAPAPAHAHVPLQARDLHPATPILLAELDETIPAFIVEREMVVNMAELAELAELEQPAEREHEPQVQAQADQIDEHVIAETSSGEDDDALIESEFEISAPYGGYGGFGGYGGGYGFGGYGGGFGGKKGGFGGGYKKVPYKKVPFKKVPIKKGPPKKKLPPKKKGGFGGYGGFGYGGGFGGKKY